MAKKNNNQTETIEAPVGGEKRTRFSFGKLLFLLIIVGVLWGMWLFRNEIKTAVQSKQKVVEEKIVYVPAPQPNQDLSGIYSRIDHLESKIMTGQNYDGVEKLNQKFEALEKNNLNIIDSKADAAVVLGIVNRLDKIEDKLDKLARVTDESALTLTAVMLVKDAAERGGKFEYEAEMLSQISQSNLQVRESVEKIAAVSTKGIKTNSYLVGSFAEVYKDVLKKQKAEFEKNWKDRVNNKLSEYVKVRRTGDKEPEFEKDADLVTAKKLVGEENFEEAVRILEKPENAAAYGQEENLQRWIEEVKTKQVFNAAVSQVANNSLAVMKINSMKKETAND